MEEEELEDLREQQRKFHESRKREQLATQRLEEQERRLSEERERRIAQQREVYFLAGQFFPKLICGGKINWHFDVYKNVHFRCTAKIFIFKFNFQVRRKEKETAEKIAARAYAQNYLMGKFEKFCDSWGSEKFSRTYF